MDRAEDEECREGHDEVDCKVESHDLGAGEVASLVPGCYRKQDESGIGDGGVGEKSFEVGLRNRGEVSDKDGCSGKDGENGNCLVVCDRTVEEGLENAKRDGKS